MSVSLLNITVDRPNSITLWASRSEESACLVIEAEETYCEIQLDRAAVTTLRDHLPVVLAGLDRWAAEEDGCTKAGRAEQRAIDAAAKALDIAAAAEAAGTHHLAASLRAAATEATTRANMIDGAVRAFENATAEADHAVEKLIYAVGEARDKGLR